MRNKRFVVIIGFFVVAISLGFVYLLMKEKETKLNDINSFEIVILDFSLFSNMPGIGYTIDTSWPVLKEAYPSKTIYSIKGEDIEQYDWKTQTITLTVEGTTALIQAFEDCEEKSIAACLTNFPFVVVFDHEPVYGGLFLIGAPWPQAWDFPVMYVYPKGNQVEFAIRPKHTIFKRYSESEWEVIMDERIRQLFADEESVEE